jgi:hypothetical protein
MMPEENFTPLITTFSSSSSPLHYWKQEINLHLGSQSAKARSFATQHILCLSATGQPVGMIRRVPPRCPNTKPIYCGRFRTAWFTCGQVAAKSHSSLQAAKAFLERKFTRSTKPVRTRSTASQIKDIGKKDEHHATDAVERIPTVAVSTPSTVTPILSFNE